MKRKLWAMVVLVGVVMAIPVSTRVASADAVVIRLATLAPAGSTWYRVFDAWGKTLQKETGGALSINLYSGGSIGDERDILRKMKLGQLDAGAFTSVGLGQISTQVLILQAPGLFSSQEELTRVRESLKTDSGQNYFEAQFEKAGYKLLGWGDVGYGRIFSKKPVVSPEDYKSVLPWVPREDPILPEALNIIGANGVPLGITEVLPALSTNRVDTIMASAMAVLALQWYKYLNHVSKGTQTTIIGATVLRKELYDKLSPEHKAVLDKRSKDAHTLLVSKVLKEDLKTYEMLVQREKYTEFDPLTNKAKWDKVHTALLAKLTGHLWPQDLVDRVKAIKASAK